MRTGTLWHVALLSVAFLGGCPKSSTPGEDCPPALPEGSCYDDCCTYLGEPTRTESCGFECRSGRLVDRCAPTSACRLDGGTCSLDAALPICEGGDCCEQERAASFDPATCTFSCPDAFSTTCEPAPDVFCAPPLDFCTEPTDCVLAIDTCCGPCGIPTLDAFDAIHRDRTEEHRELVCPDPSPVCPACAVGVNPNLGATCDDTDRCVGFDVRTLALSRCTDDDECRIRATACCTCGADTSPYSLIAIRADAEGDYAALVCPDAVGCPECEPVYPDDVSAYCEDDGHCAVRIR
jgi:hypothetical protein